MALGRSVRPTGSVKHLRLRIEKKNLAVLLLLCSSALLCHIWKWLPHFLWFSWSLGDLKEPLGSLWGNFIL